MCSCSGEPGTPGGCRFYVPGPDFWAKLSVSFLKFSKGSDSQSQFLGCCESSQDNLAVEGERNWWQLPDGTQKWPHPSTAGSPVTSRGTSLLFAEVLNHFMPRLLLNCLYCVSKKIIKNNNNNNKIVVLFTWKAKYVGSFLYQLWKCFHFSLWIKSLLFVSH